MKTITTPIVFALMFTACFFTSIASAQEEDVFELSPFVVDTSGDEGYLARNTLSGSRLNSQLKDTAAAITVFTPELIDDLGATSIEEAMLYGTNITDSTGHEEATINGNSLSEFDTVFYARGLPASRARNYFRWEIASDTFNVGRIDQSRGPNSILFGIGSPGGIVNTTTKQAILGDAVSRVKLTAGSWNLLRGEFDHNMQLIPDKMAIRVNAMISESDSWRDFEFDDQKRLHVALKYRVTSNSELRAEVEIGSVSNIKNRPWPGVDSLSSWLDAGSPIRTGSAADNSSGIGRIGGNYVTYVDNTDALINMRQTLTTQGTFGIILDEDLVAYDNGFAGPAATRDTDYHTYSIFYDVEPLKNLHFQLAYNKQFTDFVSYDPQNAAQVIRGNPNASLPDGSTEFAGWYYSEPIWENRNRERDLDTFRISASYELETERFGRHRIAGMYEDNSASTLRSENRLFLEGAPLNNSPENDNNMIRVRHYVSPDDPNGFVAADWRNVLGSHFTHTDGNDYEVVWGQRNQNIDDDKEENKSLMFALQSYFLKDRLVATFGYRKDEVDILDRGTKRGDPVAPGKNGWWEVDYDNVSTPSFEATTRTFGLVGHITDNITAFANKSDNTGLPKFTQNLLPNSTTPPPSTGEGEDYGLHFELMEGRIFATVSYYETSAVGLTAFGTRGAVEDRQNRVLDAIVTDGGLSNTEADALRVVTNVYSFDQVSTGYEFSVTANLTKNWKLILNYANGEVVQSNIASEVEKWWDEMRPLWDANASLSTGNLTVAEEAQFLQDWLDSTQSLDGTVSQGSHDHTLRLFTNYTFADGRLEGFKVGGGLRYVSGSALGLDSNNGVYWGNSQTIFDLLLGYSFKAFDGNVPIKLQLNVKNLFDEGDPYLTRANTAGVINRVNVPMPRQFVFSAEFQF